MKFFQFVEHLFDEAQQRDDVIHMASYYSLHRTRHYNIFVILNLISLKGKTLFILFKLDEYWTHPSSYQQLYLEKACRGHSNSVT